MAPSWTRQPKWSCLSLWRFVYWVSVASDAWLLSGTNVSPLLRRKNVHLSSSLAQGDIEMVNGPWNSTLFGATKCWGRRPLLLREAFVPPVSPNDSSDVQELSPFPSWDEILELACCANNKEDPDMAESLTCRLIRQEPGALDSFTLEFGPFSDMQELQDSLLQNSNDDQSTVLTTSTLVINDVDRWIPELSDWMDKHFDFLPRWRRDDAQVSLAAKGGGIGPHVDNYDVFLIQMSGCREWEVALGPISVQEEFDHLVEGSQVRILNGTNVSTLKLQLEPGDCLYLPPRFQHCGTATSDDCVTLSVGCRAPSASDLLSKVAESVATSARDAAVRRFTDENLFTTASSSSRGLNQQVMNDMKTLVADLVQNVLADEVFWDELVGKLVTEPNRPVLDYPVPLYEMDSDWRRELGIWANPETALEGVKSGKGVLRRAEGVSFAWSTLSTNDSIKKLYTQGRVFAISCDKQSSVVETEAFLDQIANGPPINKSSLETTTLGGAKMLNSALHDLLIELLKEGFLYGDDT